MLTICCVKWGSKYGPEYVNILYDMVLRNLAEGFPGRFVCFTDNKEGLDIGIQTRPLPYGLDGWWNKLYLFQKGVFGRGERVLYFDLDTLITGRLDEIAGYAGKFCILADLYRQRGWDSADCPYQSAVMAWEGGFGAHIWDKWIALGCPNVPGGDQAWIEQQVANADLWQNLYPGLFESYKLTGGRSPEKASVVVFHGEPRPHEVLEGWVPQVWKVGGITRAELDVICNTAQEVYMENVRINSERDLPWFDFAPAHDRQVAIVGGGPSVENAVEELKFRQGLGQEIWALNGSFEWLLKHGIRPTAHFIIDSRPENIEFLHLIPYTVYYLASQCHPSLFDKLKDYRVTVLHMQTAGMEEYFSQLPGDKPVHLLGGGTTVGMKALLVAFELGYRSAHLYGLDSSYADGKHHAYSQSLNDKETVLDVVCGEEKFRCAPWMITQVKDFQSLATYLSDRGMTITVNGTGLLPYIAQVMGAEGWRDVDVRASEILRRLPQEAPVGAELGVFAGDLSLRLLAGKPGMTLHMIDSWGDYRDGFKDTNDFHGKLAQPVQDAYFRSAKEAVRFANGRAFLHRQRTTPPPAAILDRSLDFVFIDADHTYDGCKDDIEHWTPKVKPGGWLCGHDYKNPLFPGVEVAVHEFAQKMGLSVQEGANYTWFINLCSKLEQ